MAEKAVLLVNLGTPDNPSTGKVGKYLRQFLNDHRVIDISALGRFFLVNFIIIPFRVKKSAALYKSIWTERGSPLLFHSEDLTRNLSKSLGSDYSVELAMRYGSPSVSSALKKLQKEMPKELIIVPLYPQYASSTVGSVYDDVFRELKTWQIIPHLKSLSRFYDDERFLNAWVNLASNYDLNSYDHILFSYHGLPQRQIKKASAEIVDNKCLTEGCCEKSAQRNYYCYRANCFDQTRLLAERLNLTPSQHSICFQSRLGNDEWLKPYAEDVIKDLAAKGKKRILVFAPAFVSDCLETIEEIGHEYNELFKEHGGGELTMVPSLNSSPAWVEGLSGIISEL